jgi:trk system potassium uptake protein
MASMLSAARRPSRGLELRPVLLVIGWLMVALGAAMILPAVVDYLAVPVGPTEPFFGGAAASVALGGILIAANRGGTADISLRQGYIFTVLAWVSVAAVGALPLAFSPLGLSYTDAFFETMSGLTTTGSTVMVGLDTMPESILLWRALMQWLGGVGIIVMAIAILPWLRSGGMQLFHAESSDRSDKPMPRLTQVTAWIGVVYLGLSLLCAVGYRATGMSRFDAVAHAMTTIATGGYATSDASFAAFPAAAQWVAIVFMIAGAAPFLLYVRAMRGDWSIVRDRQIHVMLLVLLAATVVLALWLHRITGRSLDEALRAAAFNVTSIMTTTGYASEDYGLWGPLAVGVFFYLMFVGGCTGSTSGAIKIFRFRVLFIVLVDHTVRRFKPHRMAPRSYDGRPLTVDVVEGVMAFLAVYFLTVAVIALACAASGLDWLTALSGSVQAVGNIGPGLGPIIGPAGNFTSLPDGAKWILAFGMLLGRLELFTVLVLLAPQFWRG